MTSETLICRSCGQPFYAATGWRIFNAPEELVIERRRDRDDDDCRICQMGAYMKAPEGLQSSKDIGHCHQYLQGRWEQFRRRFMDLTGNDLFLTSTYRSPAAQFELWRQGREIAGPPCVHDGHVRGIGNCTQHPLGLTVTRIDGKSMLSNHNFFPSRAFDVCVDKDPRIDKVAVTWDVKEYQPLIQIAGSLSLISGGSWENFKDWPHIEMPRGVPQ